MPEPREVQTSLTLTGDTRTLARSGSLSLVQTFRNLLAMPSVHYQPAFAVAVAEVFARTPPAAVAIELAEEWSAEIEWGASCWPAPVASHAPAWGRFLPVVPGDSILEAYRLARESGVPVFLVDRAVAGEVARAELPCLDGNLAPRVGERFQSALDALQEASGPPAVADVAREAFMAWSLAALMRKHESVLWVGGMAHWTRIRDRIERGDFTSLETSSAPAIGETRRYRLDATALHAMTAGRLPWLVARYARERAGYDERDALRDLSLDAVGEGRFQAIEVAAMLTYARNLAALRDLRETPDLWELITAASASLDERYAGRLVTLALRNRFAGKARDCALLSWGRDPERPSTFRSGGENVEGEPVWRAGRRTAVLRVPPRLTDFRERRLKKPYSRVRPARGDEKTSWVAMPDEEAAYEAFVRYLLEHAEVPDPEAGRSSPFVSGLGDGVDVRATIRRWHEGRVYVREHDRTRVRITNGLIDFDSDVEASPVNLNDASGRPTGWVDPSLLHVGSASWEIGPVEVVQREPAHVTRRVRRVSLLTLDAPTYLPRDDTKSFYGRVIKQLVDREFRRGRNDLYSWLAVMFAFCRNKPFAWYSRYVPGARVHEIARRFGVRVVHQPLGRVPRELIERNRTFHFLCVTREQWEDLVREVAEDRRAWAPELAWCDVRAVMSELPERQLEFLTADADRRRRGGVTSRAARERLSTDAPVR